MKHLLRKSIFALLLFPGCAGQPALNSKSPDCTGDCVSVTISYWSPDADRVMPDSLVFGDIRGEIGNPTPVTVTYMQYSSGVPLLQIEVLERGEWVVANPEFSGTFLEEIQLLPGTSRPFVTRMRHYGVPTRVVVYYRAASDLTWRRSDSATLEVE